VTYRMPTINSTPATMAAISGNLLRLPDVPVPEVWIIGSPLSSGAFSRRGESAVFLWVFSYSGRGTGTPMPHAQQFARLSCGSARRPGWIGRISDERHTFCGDPPPRAAGG